MILLEYDRRYLNQWGLEQRVLIDNFLPGTWVEFSIVNGPRSGTLITEAYEECGHVFANIPNVLLQDFGYLHVYVNPDPRDMAHTPEEKDFKICRKPKPSYYIYTETPTVSYSSKVDIFWGEEHAGKALVVGDDGYVKAAEKSIDDSIATDDEVGDMFDDVFDNGDGTGGDNTGGDNTGGETPNPENPTPENPDPEDPGDDNTGNEGTNGDNIATDEEVNDMFDDVFGN